MYDGNIYWINYTISSYLLISSLKGCNLFCSLEGKNALHELKDSFLICVYIYIFFYHPWFKMKLLFSFTIARDYIKPTVFEMVIGVLHPICYAWIDLLNIDFIIQLTVLLRSSLKVSIYCWTFFGTYGSWN